jgi:hypothetical protein
MTTIVFLSSKTLFALLITQYQQQGSRSTSAASFHAIIIMQLHLTDTNHRGKAKETPQSNQQQWLWTSASSLQTTQIDANKQTNT